MRWCETQPWSESYICQHFVGVRSFYKTCVRDDVLLRNPADFVDVPKVHEEGQKRTFLTPLEFAAFLEASRQAGSVEHAAAALMGLSGLRVGEMCHLRVELLSQDGGYDSLKFMGKGGKPADIPLPVPVMRAVRVVVAGRTSGPLLLNRAGNALTTLDARRMVNRLARTAGCRHITPHGLRHTFCAPPAWSVEFRCATCRSPCVTPTHGPPGCTTWPRTTRTGTPATASPPSSPA